MSLYIKTVFVTGIGTEVGKTFVSNLLVGAFKAHYWKPIQAGMPSDSAYVHEHNAHYLEVQTHPETYKLSLPASPHIAMDREGVVVQSETIYRQFLQIRQAMPPNKCLFVEGVGGLLSPINHQEQNIHLIKKLNLPVMIVSKHYLGSISHSLLTAQVLKAQGVRVLGWIFNGTKLSEDYEQYIVQASGIPKLYTIEAEANPKNEFLLKKIKKAIEPSLM